MPRWLYYLLGMAVVAPAIDLIWGPQQALAIFVCSILALVPLALVIGRVTEDLEYYTGSIGGGLLNATFGNAPELIFGIFALHANLLTVVKASMAGSVLSNSLLVLGSSLALGGWRWGRQYFNARDAGQYAAMLLLAIVALVLPSAGALIIQDVPQQQTMSVAIAIVMLVVYALYLTSHVFQVRAERRNPRERGKLKAAKQDPVAQEDTDLNGQNEAAGDEEHQPPNLWLLLVILSLATIGTAWNSELLVNAIEPVTRLFGWSPLFVGLVIIPMVGNAAEHTSAVYIALRDRVDLSMAIAAGSSIQVASFVTPALVLISMFFSSHLNLVFSPLELVGLGVATLLFSLISLDGESSWLAGVQLMAVYLMACIIFFFIPG